MSDVDINRSHWDSMAGVHGNGTDRIYDVDALIAGGDSRTGPEREAVAEAIGELDGKRVMHLQSHIGYDAISMARLGAEVTAVDFSPVALAKARATAERCGVALETVESEATNLPAELHDRFDLVYANLGALCWIEELEAWMRAAGSALVTGGHLVLVDLHPIAQMVDETDPLKLGFDYAFSGRFEEAEDGSYADPDAAVDGRTVVYAHSLGETFGAATAAGLTVERLREHLELEFDCWGGGELVLEDDGRYRLRQDGYALPLLFTLIAYKP
ncbi:MAG: class I SAM-dependent methyltransferase [Actinomycetota bacterium]|nr:class I SAM-dependent methyltransferase [Actinomycetota bacterium]